MAKSADEARQTSIDTFQSQIIPASGTISNTGASTGYQGITATVNQDASILFNMPELDRKDLAQRLKNAGYKVAVTGKYSDKLLSAYSTAAQKAALQSQMVGKAFTVRQYLDQETAARIAEGGTGNGPTSTVQTRVSTPLEGRELINKIFEDLLGRGATKAEFDKYYSQVTKRQKAMPTTTTYSGGKRNVVTQSGGPDVEEFLFQKIAGTDEAKSKKVFGFYDIFKQALGVD